MKMTLTLTIAAVISLGSLPAAAHKMPSHGGSKGWVSAQPQKGACPYTAAEFNMVKVEKTFRAMPQSTRMNLQHMLRHAGLYTGSDDGIWGPKTECAMKAVVGRFKGAMRDEDMIAFFEYMLDGGFIQDYPGTPNPFPHPDTLY